MSSVTEIKERIRLLISAKGLTPSKFADIIGVQRSGISHILSGRNKPGLDVLYKILANFPDISGDWLITGEGDMVKAKQKGGTQQEELFPPQEQEGTVREPENVNREEEMPPYGKRNTKEYDANREKARDVKKEAPDTSDAAPGGRRIEKIVVFYADRTFREYSPE